MAKKSENKSIEPITGWFLISRDEIDGRKIGHWYIAWETPFNTKKSALAFAGLSNWSRPYRAVRGQITVQS